MTILLSIGILYLLLLFFYVIGYLKINIPEPISGAINSSVLIPFRNEEENLPRLIHSIRRLKKPLGEVEFIFINDHSLDKSEQIIRELIQDFPFQIKVLNSLELGKKQALKLGVETAQYDFIITTDADCELPVEWLHLIQSYKVQFPHKKCWVMPINLKSSGSLFQDLQQLESSALVAMSSGALAYQIPLTANGANLAFDKAVFNLAKGYEPEMDIPGGDDEFLVKRIHALNPYYIQVVKDPKIRVIANPAKNFYELKLQRIRWASKVSFKKWNLRQLLIMIPALMMITLLLSMIPVLFMVKSKLFAGLIMYKWLADSILFLSFRKDFQYPITKLGLIVLMPFYQLIYMIPVFYQMIFKRGYEWKGRKYGN